jgi:DNA-binding response OmpR family regulator
VRDDKCLWKPALVIGTDPTIRRLIVTALERNDLPAVAPKDHVEPDDRYGCIVVDVRSPKVTAIPAMRKIRKACPFTPIIMIISEISEEISIEARALNVEILPKPFHPGKLVSMVRDSLLRGVVRKVSPQILSIA